ncbi:DNA cytosine methyltransferase [Puniceicoccus vermicola]|uniref:Cytosine-specific methyltransferase n=1 Tax=Puniceicoccus vermicola TaxID=388746 RepID=A0A7X1E7Z0_9BACT|nr:DNA cytosine methyltransferase [Puniceicoccus vermicola]MBC2604237.1 DNA cytosine methyltransferase [Puniceicoccus vermicola]
MQVSIEPVKKKGQTLKINGVARYTAPKANALVVDHKRALQVILASEASSDFPPHVQEELPAIVSHWLQNPKETPILLDMSYAEKWLHSLRVYAQLEKDNPAKGTAKPSRTPKPVHINFSSLPFQPVMKPKFTFIDLFAGIGGFRIALEELCGKCVFSSEWDRHAKETYFHNYGEVPFGDITKVSNHQLFKPGYIDIIAGGFPCQPFSKAGVSARESLGQNHGFKCETQGQLFFDVIKLAKIHQPKVLLLENVGNLLRHDGGNTFHVIKETIENDLGYDFHYSVYNANTLVPQNRIRCIIVAFQKTPKNWSMPELKGEPLPLSLALEDVPWDSPYTLSDKMWAGHIKRSQRNVDRGAGFTAYPKDITKPSTTLVARYYKDGKECLIPQPKHPEKVPRMLTERECANLQGFPATFIPHESKVNAYKQFGNAVPAPLIKAVAESFVNRL